MNDTYESPFNSRYSGEEMQYQFSHNKKFTTWRKLWTALAEAQKELGLPITDMQIDEMKAHISDINYEVAQERELEVRHDVMAHVHAFGEQCPNARPIIHLGATSCYVGDNADIIIMYEALDIVRKKIIHCIRILCDFAIKYKDMPTLGFTHFQPAQLTTVGKRATLWIQDLVMDLDEIDNRVAKKRLLGSKGTTGTQASFMELFNNDEQKVKKLDELIAKKMFFSDVFPVSGQTYPRKLDFQILNILSGIAQSAHKFSNDIRLLQHMKEIKEPFEASQIGSSAMAYKRNPMRCERMASLSRHLIINSLNPAVTASQQWFERTLDDSANKRICIPEAFLATDAILSIYSNVAAGLEVFPKVIESRIREELPFMATEAILMSAVLKGKDRQELHEIIRVHSMAAAKRVSEEGLPNDLLERILSDPRFGLSIDDINEILIPDRYIGRAPGQTEEYIGYVKENILKPNLIPSEEIQLKV